MFKKKKIKKTNNKIINFFTIFSIIIVLILAILTINSMKNSYLNVNGKSLKSETGSSNNKIILKSLTGSNINKKLDLNKINILLLGRGGQLNDAPNLTDTIILASINKEYKTITMLSIPRDLYVEYLNGKSGKINQIYAIQKHKLKNSKKAIKILENKITQITGEKIDYYINVDFKGFSAFIDAIGGIKITVPKTLIDPKYPDGNWGYRTLIIKKGTWLFDGDVALMYARSRHSTSDFDRSLRQQQILKAIKDKLNEGGFFSKAMKIKKFYEVFKKYVETDLSLMDMLKIFNEIGTGDDYKILSFNINDSCFYGDPDCKAGGFLYVPKRELYGGASVLLPKKAYLGNISDYTEIRKYSKLIFNYPEIYKENYKINIYNSTRIRGIAGDLASKLIKYGLNIPKYKGIGNIRDKKYKKTTLYYNSNIEKSYTLNFLKEILGNDIVLKSVDMPIKSEDEEVKIEIVLGDNYKKVFNSLESNL